MKRVAYKLTDQNMRTYNWFQWELNKAFTTSGEGDLCTEGWLHVYSHPLLAILHNPMHANIINPRLFKARVGGKFKDDNGLKCGYTSVQLVEELSIPQVSLSAKVAYGILCVLEVYHEKKFVRWATRWLENKDRSYDAADAAAYAARAYAADAAAYAAYNAAARAARNAAYAANDAARAARNNALDLIKLAKKAMKYNK